MRGWRDTRDGSCSSSIGTTDSYDRLRSAGKFCRFRGQTGHEADAPVFLFGWAGTYLVVSGDMSLAPRSEIVTGTKGRAESFAEITADDPKVVRVSLPLPMRRGSRRVARTSDGQAPQQHHSDVHIWKAPPIGRGWLMLPYAAHGERVVADDGSVVLYQNEGPGKVP